MSARSASAKPRARGQKDERPDSRPDLRPLFDHYNDLYFAGEVGSCSLEWSSKKTSLAGNCICSENGCHIRLSEPILKWRSSADVKGTLLHEMIHAHLFFANNNTDHDDHSDLFRRKVRQILNSPAEDQERPSEGYSIRLEHTFNQSICLKAEEAVFPMKKTLNSRAQARPKTESARESNASREIPAKGKALSKRKIDNQNPNKSSKVRRLELLYGVSNLMSRKASDQAVRSTHSGGTTQNSSLNSRNTEMPDVIIAWKKWCAYEPDEEIEPLIDRRRERRQKEKVGLEPRMEDETSKEIASVRETKVREDCSNSLGLVLYEEKRDSVSTRPSPSSEDYATSGSLVLSNFRSSGDRGQGNLVDLESDGSLALVPVGELEMEPLQIVAPWKEVTPLKCFERRRKGQHNRERTTPREKPPVTATTVCPICSKAFEFDMMKPDENAKFNTHVDECLNQHLV